MNRNKVVRLLVIATVAGLSIYYWYPHQKIVAGVWIDQIVVHKSAQQMEVYSNKQLVKTYTIAIGKNPVGAKQYQLN